MSQPGLSPQDACCPASWESVRDSVRCLRAPPKLPIRGSATLQDGPRLLRVVDHEGDVCGLLNLVPSQWWYSEDWFLGDCGFFVRADVRKTRAAALLVEAAQKAARDAGLPLYLGLVSKDDLGLKTKFLQRFMTPVGVVFAGG